MFKVWNKIVEVGDRLAEPEKLRVEQNYPNPSNPSTLLEFRVPDLRMTALTIYDVLGGEVAMLVNEMKVPGWYLVNWNRRGVASGAYSYTLEAGVFVQIKRMMLLK
jgi:hypothetical protein